MGEDWQSWVALAVVLITIAISIWRTFFNKRNSPTSTPSCGTGSCGCSKKWQAEDFANREPEEEVAADSKPDV